MKNYLKRLSRLPKNLRNKIIKAIDKITVNDLKGLDIKLLTSEYKVYRCRVGKIRILFRKMGELNIIMDMGFRGDVYKDM